MKDIIINLLKNGESINEISKKLKKSYYSIQKVAKEIGFNFIKFKEDKIKSLQPITPNECRKITGYGRPFIIKVYKKYNLYLEGSGGKNRIINNISMFTDLTSESYYWLGMLITDGNLTSKKYGINLIQKDIQLLEDYKKFLNCASLKLYKNKNCYTISFGNKDLYYWLNSLGITAKKSLSLDLKIDLNWHLLRGMWDGDGTISKNCTFVTASNKLAKKISDYLNLNNISHKLYKDNSSKNICYRIYIHKKNEKLFLNNLYKDSTIHLKRKYENAVKLTNKKSVNAGKSLI